MKHSVTVATLTGGVQVEWVNWLLVPAYFTDKSSATADKTGSHVTNAEPDSRGQGRDQFT